MAVATYKLNTFDQSNNRPKLQESELLEIIFKEIRVEDLAAPSNYSAADNDLSTHLAGIDAALASAGGNEFADNLFRIQDNGDATKELAFEVSAITTATTRTITMPDEDVDLGDMAKESVLSSTSNGEGASTVSIEDSGAIYTATDVEGALAEVKGIADAAIPDSEKGANNGVATLDAGGKVPVAQLPNAVMTYEGVWNASTNTPTLSDGTGNAGEVYRVSTAGTQDLGSGNISFEVGDYAIHNGSAWEKSDTTDAVASVNGQTGIVSLDTDDIGEGTSLYFTDERAQDAVGGILTNTGDIDFTYDDAANTIVADISDDSVTALKIASDVAGLGLQQASDGSLESGAVKTLTNDDAGAFAAREFGLMEADGNVVKVDATDALDLGSTSVVALEAVSAAASGKYATGGYKLGGFTGLNEEQPLYLSRTAAGGYVQSLTGFVAGEHIVQLGQAISATEIWFDPKYIAEL